MISPSRVRHMFIVMTLFYILIAFNLWRMQVWKGSYYHSLSEKNRLRVFYLEAPRGQITDRVGKPVVTNRLSYNVSVFRHEARNSIHKSVQRLSEILEVESSSLEKRFERKLPGAYRTILLAEDIPAEKAMRIEEISELLPGIVIETRPQREYPLGKASAHLTGYLGPLSEKELEELDLHGYEEQDWLGKEGIERTYESYLKGRSGGLQIEVNNRGRMVRALGIREPHEGKDIQLTIDVALQSVIYQMTTGQKGAVAVMDLRDGGLLAIESFPAFDPNLFSSRAGRSRVGTYFIDADTPLVNRAIHSRYPPGSIFKIVTATAALEASKITPFTQFNCPGFLQVGNRQFPCWNHTGHGPQNLSQALAHSCNVFFYHAGLALGQETLADMARTFHLSNVSEVDLPGERKGHVPSKEWKKRILHEPWYDGDTANMSIGQGFVEMTPMQALVMVSAAATGGQIYKPHVVSHIEKKAVVSKSVRPIPIRASTWAALREGLNQVVNSDTGTGKLARGDKVRVAGKTGTAQSGQDKTHAWYVGYAPTQKPRFAMVVFIEGGGRGGVAAGGLAGAIWKWIESAGYFA